MTRRYAYAIADIIGPHTDIPAPDVYTGGKEMAWIVDTYSALKGNFVQPEVITGKPIAIGGSLGRNEATGRGLAFTVREAAKKLKLNMKAATVAVQGFGNAGQFASQLVEEQGATVIAASDSRGGIYKNKILNIPDILANGGGVTVSYFEWLQNLRRDYWTEAEVNERLDRNITKSFLDTFATSEEYGVNMRKASTVLAVNRVVEAVQL